MKNWFLERAKAWAAAFSAGIVSAAIRATEESLGIDIDSGMELTIIAGATAAISGLVTWAVPNRPKP